MSDYTWQDVANAILEGSREFPECRGSLALLNDSKEIVEVCALGAGQVASMDREIFQSFLSDYEYPQLFIGQALVRSVPCEYYAAQLKLLQLYKTQFGALITTHNDNVGRDVVLANLKEMLNEDSAS